MLLLANHVGGQEGLEDQPNEAADAAFHRWDGQAAPWFLSGGGGFDQPRRQANPSLPARPDVSICQPVARSAATDAAFNAGKGGASVRPKTLFTGVFAGIWTAQLAQSANFSCFNSSTDRSNG